MAHHNPIVVRGFAATAAQRSTNCDDWEKEDKKSPSRLRETLKVSQLFGDSRLRRKN